MSIPPKTANADSKLSNRTGQLTDSLHEDVTPGLGAGDNLPEI